MSKSKRKQLDKQQNNADDKAETRKRIEAVLEAKAEELEKAAEELAPDFDYEAAAAELSAEEGESAEPEEKPLPPAEVSPSRYPKPKRVPKTAFGRYFLRDVHHKTFGVMILMLLAVIAWQWLDYYIPETVHLTYRTLVETQTADIETRTKTVAELLDELSENGYEITEQDAVSLPDDRPIADDMELMIARAKRTCARIEGQEREISLIPGTVRENLEFNGITYDDDDEVKPALDKEVSEKTAIVFNEVHYKTKDKKETVEAGSLVILDPKLASGVEERIEGNDGEGVFTYTYKYVNGKKVNTDRAVKEWITEPHDNELRLGTSATGNTGKYKVVRTFIANCTAYTSRPGAGGALGLGVHYGTCAVDPTFISYCSELWIEDYGYAFANDCGGAVKGNVVDLWMGSTSACIQWGRRDKTAYVLEPIE